MAMPSQTAWPNVCQRGTSHATEMDVVGRIGVNPHCAFLAC